MGINLSVILPEIVLVISACLILFLSFINFPHKRNVLNYFSLVGPLLSFIILLHLANQPNQIGDFFIQDSFSFYCRGLLLIIGFLVLLSSQEMFSVKSKREAEFISLLQLSLCGLMFMTQATHLLTLYLSVEMSSIPLYMIAGLKSNDSKSKEAIVKYFLLGAFASAILIYGTSLIFAATDQLSFVALARIVRTEPLVFVGSIMILISLAFKMAAVPFHFWAPDVYEGAPPISSAFISTGPKIGVLVVLCRFVFMGIGNPMKSLISYLILAIALLSMFAGNLSAIWQKEVKRLMAFSSIAQIGNMLLAIFVIGLPVLLPKELALKGLLFYITAYSFANIGIFSLISLVDRIKKGTHLKQFQGIAREYPEIAIPMTLLVLSLLGIPILGGFFSKLLIFSSLIQNFHYTVLVLAIINSVISAFFYLQIVRVMFTKGIESSEPKENVFKNPALTIAILCSILLVIIGLIPFYYHLLEGVSLIHP